MIEETRRTLLTTLRDIVQPTTLDMYDLVSATRTMHKEQDTQSSVATPMNAASMITGGLFMDITQAGFILPLADAARTYLTTDSYVFSQSQESYIAIWAIGALCIASVRALNNSQCRNALTQYKERCTQSKQENS